MKTRIRLFSFVLTLVLFGIYFLAGTYTWAKDHHSSTGAAVSDASASANDIVVYYFFTNFRCASCFKIETFTKQALDENFVQELNQKKILWRPVNTDIPQNAHFVNDFQLYTKSIVLVQLENGKVKRWKNLPKIWQLLNDQDAFTEYITDEIVKFYGDE